MARRSARIQAQRRANTSSELQDSNVAQPLLAFQDEDQNIEEQEDLIEDERPRKRARNNPEGPRKKKKRRVVSKLSRKVRGRLGLLERLSKDIPLDVILEIFCYLEPRDLLRLARTSLDLRHILMSRTSESIWRAARENVEGLPPCPADLNEPQYAHIFFEPFCHVCGRRVEGILWSFRARYCKDCALGSLSICTAEFLAQQPEEFRSASCKILPRELFYTAKQHANERTVWIAQKKEESERILEHRHLCEMWFSQKELERSRELSKIRRQRKKDILIRLDEIGWRQEAEAMMKTSKYRDPFSEHELVKQPRKLTDYGWNTIKDKLVEMSSDHKKTGLAAV
ncbi:hypothetical protein C8J55DRAFT_88025 [Lentinula edodes]|uniref:F-box domain-containing protein n=1 Tax=Lentinula lateritia TaxID=40482 RepID=A0A9W9AB02_9AGAR|nr:hypothetical protein C8J55DRAFT_88025 [Lentinula edodes]